LKTFHLITVGKLKDKNVRSLEEDYLKRIKNPLLKIHELKAHSENLEKEAAEVLAKLNSLNNPYPIVLAENGQQFNSVKFSEWLYGKFENHHGDICFIIGGAAGHGQQVLSMAKSKISLGEMTYPHQLARLLLVEQLYRAQTIHERHPYHK
jgi:23S rRNA (pseudouridine1915-N3)-methyltransferase